MVTLHWPRKSQFRDPDREFIVTGPTTEDIPDSSEEQYRGRGWEDPPDESGSDSPTPVDQAVDPDDEGESDVDFNPAEFIDRSWQAVKGDIEAGEADGHLDAVREAEQDRDSPRGSVIGSIEDRQG